MQRGVSGFVRTLILATGICSAQIPQPQAGPAHHVEIKLPPGIASESVFIRYRLAGEELGGWVQPRPGVSSYFISTTREGCSVNQIKALFYAPGCALQTLDLALSGSNGDRFAPCSANPPQVHDATGFGLRPDPSGACDP
jgi:hypothetical protein